VHLIAEPGSTGGRREQWDGQHHGQVPLVVDGVDDGVVDGDGLHGFGRSVAGCDGIDVDARHPDSQQPPPLEGTRADPPA
jgi:hypothetical protein